MEVIDVLGVIVVLVLLVVGVTYVVRNDSTARLRAEASANAGIGPHDTRAEVIAKRRLHDQVMESVRILSQVRAQDDILPILPGELRRAVDNYLEDFFGPHR